MTMSLTFTERVNNWKQIIMGKNIVHKGPSITSHETELLFYSLETAKKRILEYLSVVKVKGDLKAPIICFVGPVNFSASCSLV